MLNSCFTVNGNCAGHQQTKSFPMLHFVFAAAFTTYYTRSLAEDCRDFPIESGTVVM